MCIEIVGNAVVEWQRKRRRIELAWNCAKRQRNWRRVALVLQWPSLSSAHVSSSAVILIRYCFVAMPLCAAIKPPLKYTYFMLHLGSPRNGHTKEEAQRPFLMTFLFRRSVHYRFAQALICGELAVIRRIVLLIECGLWKCGAWHIS